MYIVDLEKKIVHNLSITSYECHISKIPLKMKKKIFTEDGIKRFLGDPLNREYKGCKYCMPDYYEYDMNSIFRA